MESFEELEPFVKRIQIKPALIYKRECLYISMCICAECEGGPWRIGGTQLKGKRKEKEEEKNK